MLVNTEISYAKRVAKFCCTMTNSEEKNDGTIYMDISFFHIDPPTSMICTETSRSVPSMYIPVVRDALLGFGNEVHERSFSIMQTRSAYQDQAPIHALSQNSLVTPHSSDKVVLPASVRIRLIEASHATPDSKAPQNVGNIDRVQSVSINIINPLTDYTESY